jgi:hypothetical protein
MRFSVLCGVLLLFAAAGPACSGKDEDGPASTATIGVDATAQEIVSKALMAWEQSDSGHVVMEVTVEAQGSIVKIKQDMLFDKTRSYIESVSFGLKTLLLQQNGAACVKEPGREWRRERLLDEQDSPKTGGGILRDLNHLSYQQLDRLPDSTTFDGKSALVVRGRLDKDDLASIADAMAGQFGAGVKVTVNSMAMEVKIEREALKVREIKFDIEYGLPETTFTATTEMRIDRVNEPIAFPSDVPDVCSDGSA